MFFRKLSAAAGLCLFLVSASTSLALTPRQIVILANSDDDTSVALGRFYCANRYVPPENLIALKLPKGDDISLPDYYNLLVKPLRQEIINRQLDSQAICILVMRGVPFRMSCPMPPPKPGTPHAEQLKFITPQSSVDNELAKLWSDQYELMGWQTNPLLWRPEEPAVAAIVAPATSPAEVKPMMVCRIDGPDLTSTMRIIKDSIAVEEAGLEGTFYIDAGGKVPQYDVHYQRLAEMVKAQTDIPVVFDSEPGLFQPGTCPHAALYCGWYSLQKYVPAFTFNRGAVAYHLASFEAMHIHDPASPEWVPNLLKNGVVGTFGPTDEPFLNSFPLPEEFFPLLLSGKVTICEAYWRTLPQTSWRMMLIADPLYNPFKKKPHPMTLPAGLMPEETTPVVPVSAGLPVSPQPASQP